MSGANKISTKRPNREEIVDLFRACAAKNGGKAPGKGLFQETCAVTEVQVKYHSWKGGYAELAHEARLQPNLLQVRLAPRANFRIDDDGKAFSRSESYIRHLHSGPCPGPIEKSQSPGNEMHQRFAAQRSS